MEPGLFSFPHALAGAALLDQRHFPEQLIFVAHHHHKFEDLAGGEPEMYTPCSIINLADGFCHYFSAGYPLPDKEIDLPLSRDAYMRERSLFLS